MRVLLYNVTSRGKITSFAGKDMPVSFAFPFGGAEKKNSKDEESNESRRTVGSATSTATENHRGEQQQETVGLAFGKIWECYCAFRSPLFFLSALSARLTDVFSLSLTRRKTSQRRDSN